jgi:hypothetical protein
MPAAAAATSTASSSSAGIEMDRFLLDGTCEQ